MDAPPPSCWPSSNATISPSQSVGTLRVGDQQLIEIAKALSLEAEILIMDEPTSALTESEVARLFRVIDRLRERGVTILYISHKMDEVFRLADRITVLRDGRLGRDRGPRRNHAPRHDAPDGRPRDRRDRSRRAALGRRRGARSPESFAPLAGPCPGLAAEGHQFHPAPRRDSGHRRLDGGRADRAAGMPVRLGSRNAAAARFCSNGKPAMFHHPAEAKRAGIALVTEDRKRLGLFPHMNVGENITICTLREAATAGWLSTGRRQRMAEQMVARSERENRRASATAITSLSGGNQQKCIIGRWLLAKPQVLLLGRSHARHRRRRQGRALSPDGPALPRRPGHHRHLAANCRSC